MFETATAGQNHLPVDQPFASMSKQVSTRTCKITCLCGKVTEPGSLLVADTFPIHAGFCGCSICRRSTGALGIVPIQLTGRPSSDSLTSCKIYVASERVERYFCATCGSHVFLRYSKVDMWMTIAGVIDRFDEVRDVDTIKVTKIGFLSETRDGGFVSRMREVALKSSRTFADVKCYAQMPVAGKDVSLLNADTLWQALAPEKVQPTDKIFCGCHCGQVQFYVLRPDKNRNKLETVTHILRANDSKYVAKLCVCRSCRLATSTPFMPWTYTPPENIVTLDGKEINFDFISKLEELPGAQVHYSSKDSKRSFCGTCGATLFYEHAERSHIIDVSLGILRSERGVLAGDLVEWDWPWVSWKDSGRDNEFLHHLTAE